MMDDKEPVEISHEVTLTEEYHGCQLKEVDSRNYYFHAPELS
jgi:hypothetical protein